MESPTFIIVTKEYKMDLCSYKINFEPRIMTKDNKFIANDKYNFYSCLSPNVKLNKYNSHVYVSLGVGEYYMRVNEHMINKVCDNNMMNINKLMKYDKTDLIVNNKNLD